MARSLLVRVVALLALGGQIQPLAAAVACGLARVAVDECAGMDQGDTTANALAPDSPGVDMNCARMGPCAQGVSTVVVSATDLLVAVEQPAGIDAPPQSMSSFEAIPTPPPPQA